MPKPMPCDGCGQAQAVLLVQNVSNGETLTFCPPCSGVWAAAHAAAMTELFPAELGAGGDTPNAADAPSADDAGTDLAAQDSASSEGTQGGDEDGALRQRDSGLPGDGSPVADRGRPGAGGHATAGAGDDGAGAGADDGAGEPATGTDDAGAADADVDTAATVGGPPL